MQDAQARKEATLRRINGLKTSLARIVSSSSSSPQSTQARPLHVVHSPHHADPRSMGVVESPTPHPSSPQNAVSAVSPQADPLTYLDYAQQEVERLTVDRNQLMRTCASQERQLQQLKAGQGALVVHDGHEMTSTAAMNEGVRELVSTIERCYPALVAANTGPDSSHGDDEPSLLALTRLARVLPSLVASSRLGDALSVAGADLLERVGSLEDEVHVDHFKLLELVDQLTAVNDNLKQEALTREQELQGLRTSTSDRHMNDDTVAAERDATNAHIDQMVSELSSAQAQLNEQAERLAQQEAQLAAQSDALRQAEEAAAAAADKQTADSHIHAAKEAAARDTAVQLEQQIETLRKELAAARVAREGSEAQARTLQAERDALTQQLATHPASSSSFLHAAVDESATPAASEAPQDPSLAGESSYVSVDGEADDASPATNDKRAASRRASELKAAKRKTDTFRRQAEALAEKLQHAEAHIRALNAEIAYDKMRREEAAQQDFVEKQEAAIAARPSARRQENPLLINFAALECTAMTAASAAPAPGGAATDDVLPTVYPPGVDVTGWMGRLTADKDFTTWAEESLSPADQESISMTGAVYHVGLSMAKAAHLWCDTQPQRVAVRRLMLQIERFLDHPQDPDDDAGSLLLEPRQQQSKVVEALRFCHVCLQRLHPLCEAAAARDGDGDGDSDDSAAPDEPRMAFFIAAACQFVFTQGHHATPDSTTAGALAATENWKRVESLLEHVHRNNAAYPLFRSEKMFVRVLARVRRLLTFSTEVVALAMEVAFFTPDTVTAAATVQDAQDSHWYTVAQTALLLSQSACLFQSGDGIATADTSPPKPFNALDVRDVQSLNSSLMGVAHSPTDLLLTHIDSVVLPLATAVARAEPSMRADLLSVLACRRSLPFEKNHHWHVPNAVLEAVVAGTLDPVGGDALDTHSPQQSSVLLDSPSFVRANAELARLYRENVTLRKTVLRVVEATEAVRQPQNRTNPRTLTHNPR